MTNRLDKFAVGVVTAIVVIDFALLGVGVWAVVELVQWVKTK